ncbi:MAG: AbiH family protein [Suipraeoptans sp.]
MSNNIEEGKQLIIIGNGFDLTAKLKSTYDSFFEYYFKERIITDEKKMKKG